MKILNNIKSAWIKSKERLRYKYIRIYGIYYIGILLAIALFIYYFIFWLNDPAILTNTYSSTNIYQPVQIETSTTDSPGYVYYLDISPSMAGFIRADNSKLHTISDILKTINRATPSLNNRFYLCGNKIMNEGQDIFYSFMKQYAYMEDYYDSRINSGSLDVISGIDLTTIFTSQYEDDSRFQGGTEEVDIIITDLNFILDDSEGAKFDRFTAEIASKLKEHNISIYNIYSRFDGIFTDDYSMIGTSINNYIGNDCSFYIIIFSKNESLYNDYIEYIESLFIDNGIDYTNKYEVKNDILDGKHAFNCEETIVADKVKLNYDTKSFDRLDTNALGFRHFTAEQGNEYNSLKLNVVPLETSGNYTEAESTDIAISTEVRIYYKNGERYTEYIKNDIIKRIYAGTSVYDGKPYLYAELMLDAGRKIEENKEGYFIIDINFMIDQPQFSIPEWVSINSSVNTEAVDITLLFNRIISTKTNNFTNLSEYYRQVGNLLIYIVN